MSHFKGCAHCVHCVHIRRSLVLRDAGGSKKYVWLAAGVLDKALQRGICSAVPRVITSSDGQALFSLGLVLLDLAAFSDAAQVFARVSEVLSSCAPRVAS
jgi:hypothetical protein